MSASVARVGQALRVSTRSAWLIAGAGLVGIAVVAALATRLGMLPLTLGAAFMAVATLTSFRWPLLSLAAFAALIPIEEVMVVEGFGTLSRLAGILFAVTYAVPRLGHLTIGAMRPAAWAYLAWAIASLGWAIDPSTAWEQLQTLIQLFLIAALVADFVIRRPTIVRPLLWIYSLSAAATAVVGSWSYVVGGLADARAAAIQGQNPAQFAAVLVPALVFGLYESVNGPRRVAGGVIALLTTVGVIVSGTRGAWAAVLIVVLLLVLPQLPVRRRVVAVATIALLLGLAYQVPGISDLIAERAGNALSTGGAGRTDIWSAGLVIYQSAPVLGVGFANFPVAYTPEVVRASGISSVYDLAGYAPHNVVIATLVELGPIGLLLLAAFLGPLVLRRGWGREAAMVRAALASLLTLSLFLDIIGNRKQVWLVIGLATGLAYLGRRDKRDRILDAGTPGMLNAGDPSGTPVEREAGTLPGNPRPAARA